MISEIEYINKIFQTNDNDPIILLSCKDELNKWLTFDEESTLVGLSPYDILRHCLFDESYQTDSTAPCDRGWYVLDKHIRTFPGHFYLGLTDLLVNITSKELSKIQLNTYDTLYRQLRYRSTIPSSGIRDLLTNHLVETPILAKTVKEEIHKKLKEGRNTRFIKKITL
jgi:hypothetical protein